MTASNGRTAGPGVSARSAFLGGSVVGVALTVGVGLAARAAASGPSGATTVAAVAAVVAVAISLLVLVMNSMPPPNGP